jgi:aryl-alcohol dehydrogenase-like predicted oxidoreductase
VTDPSAVEAALRAAPPAERAERLAPAALPGRATAEGTARYAARHAKTGLGPLGRTGLVTSRIGFGGYRVDADVPAHREALAAALRSGCNLVDTSTNYTDGGSERLVGAVIADLVRRRELARDEVIVVTKIGYVQGANHALAAEREAAGTPFPDMVRYADGVWHCIHPEFLRDQLSRSLDRLGLAAADVLLLHNPEYYLSDAHERSHGTLEKRRAEFDRRIREAFAFLEGEAAAGRIGCYGVSSNAFVRPDSDPEATSLARMLELAREAGGAGHHFRVAQLPLNLLEAGGTATVARAAADGIAVLVNRPLNAMAEGGLVRLAAVEVEGGAPDPEAALAAVGALEEEYRAEIASHLEGAEGSVPPAQFFRWADDLRGVEVQGVEHWDALEQQRIVPRLTQAVEALDGALAGPLVDTWRDWRGRYLPELRKALLAFRARAAASSRERLAAIEARLDPLLPRERRGEPLARKALWVAASLPGVSCVLTGARSAAYVEDVRAVLGWPPLAEAAAVLAAVAPPKAD